MNLREKFVFAYAALLVMGWLLAFAAGWMVKPGPYHVDRVVQTPGPVRLSTDPVKLVAALGKGQTQPSDTVGLPPSGGTCHLYSPGGNTILICVP